MALFGLFKKKEKLQPLPDNEVEVVELWKKANAEEDWSMVYRTAEHLTGLGYAFEWSLGECYLYGRGVKQDTNRALYHFENAATDGSTLDMYRYAELLTEGKLVPPNPTKAQYLYRAAAGYDQPDACLKIYKLQTAGELTGTQYEEDDLAWMLFTAAVDNASDARTLFQQHAEKYSDLADACKVMADATDTEDDPEKKLELTKLAASYGNADALYNLGVFAKKGIGDIPDTYHAIRYWEAAADIYNDSDAMGRLAVLYQKDRSSHKDWEEKMLYWYTRSAEAGNGGAANNLGVYYQNQEAVKPAHRRNYKKALHWYEKGMELGSATAAYNLSKAYSMNGFVYYDKERHAFYLRKAAELGDEYAKSMVEFMDKNR